MKDPRSSAQWINIRLQNAGTLPATRIVVGTIGKSSSEAFAPEVEKKEMDDLRVKVNATIPPKDSAESFRCYHLARFNVTDVFLIATYEDEALEGNGYWVTEFFGYYLLTFSYWHNCALSPERVYRVSGSRRKG
jgi:hypothetical protein